MKACLDMRVPRHVVRFMQDRDADVRNECLLIFNEISKGLKDEDIDLMTELGKREMPDLSKQGHVQKAFDTHKDMAVTAYMEGEEILEKGPSRSKKTETAGKSTVGVRKGTKDMRGTKAETSARASQMKSKEDK